MPATMGVPWSYGRAISLRGTFALPALAIDRLLLCAFSVEVISVSRCVVRFLLDRGDICESSIELWGSNKSWRGILVLNLFDEPVALTEEVTGFGAGCANLPLISAGEASDGGVMGG